LIVIQIIKSAEWKGHRKHSKNADKRFVQSAKGAAARRRGGKELSGPFGGALDTAAVLRVFLKRHKLIIR
jgi:hypothetical protein